MKVQLKTTNTAVDMEGLKENILEKVIISECEAKLHHYNKKMLHLVLLFLFLFISITFLPIFTAMVD